MTFRDAIERASRIKSDADWWINILQIITAIFAVLLVPFFKFTSLLILIAIPPFAAIGACATNTRRTSEMVKLHLMYLADKDYDYDDHYRPAHPLD